MKSNPSNGPALAAALVVLLLGCSGSENDSGTTVSTPTSDSVITSSTTTTEPTATTVTSPTTTTSTTTSTSTTTTTEAPTTTTSEPVDTTNDAIADGLIASREAYLYAVYNLDAADAEDRLAATHAAGSPSLELALENVQTLVDNGWLARPNPDIPDTVTIESDVTMVDETTAELIACVVGAGEVYAPGANDDGSDQVVNGDIEAALNRVTMVLEDGQWKLREGTNLTSGSGTECVIE